MSVTPAALPCARITGYGLFGNVATIFAVPVLELTFPFPGLSPGMDVEEVTGEAEELLSGICFWVQRQLSFDVEPSIEPTTLDNGIWPDGLNGSQHTLLAVTDNVGWCRNERQ